MEGVFVLQCVLAFDDTVYLRVFRQQHNLITLGMLLFLSDRITAVSFARIWSLFQAQTLHPHPTQNSREL